MFHLEIALFLNYRMNFFALSNLAQVKLYFEMPVVLSVNFHVVVKLVLVGQVAHETVFLLRLVQNRVQLRFAAENLAKRHREVVSDEIRLFLKKVPQFLHFQNGFEIYSVVCDNYRYFKIFEKFSEHLRRFFQFSRNVEVLGPKIMAELNLQIFARNGISIVNNFFIQEQLLWLNNGRVHLHQILRLAE